MMIWRSDRQQLCFMPGGVAQENGPYRLGSIHFRKNGPTLISPRGDETYYFPIQLGFDKNHLHITVLADGQIRLVTPDKYL